MMITKNAMAVTMMVLVLLPLATEEACTPAQVAAADADAEAAAAILNSLAPVACGVIDVVDATNAAAICQVITDVATGATALVPIFGTLAALTQVVAARPANAAVTQAITTLKATWKPRVKK